MGATNNATDNEPKPAKPRRKAAASHPAAWKFIAIIVISLAFMLLFHDAIASRIGAITEVESKVLTVKLSPDLNRVAALAKQVPLPDAAPFEGCLAPIRNTELLIRFAKLADVNGKGAVMDAYRELEMSMIGLALKHSLKVTGPEGRVSGAAALTSLTGSAFVSADIAERYDLLHNIRGKANESSSSMEPDFAKKYICQSLVLSDEVSLL